MQAAARDQSGAHVSLVGASPQPGGPSDRIRLPHRRLDGSGEPGSHTQIPHGKRVRRPTPAVRRQALSRTPRTHAPRAWRDAQPRVSRCLLIAGPWESVSTRSIMQGFSKAGVAMKPIATRRAATRSCDSCSADCTPGRGAGRLLPAGHRALHSSASYDLQARCGAFDCVT